MASRAYIEKDSGRVYEFGPFRLDEGERSLSRDLEPVALTPKVFDTLLLLVRNAGHLVDKEELMTLIWPDSFVEEANLNRSISTLRRALGEAPNLPRYIETVPKRGYRFIAPVNVASLSGVAQTFEIAAASEISLAAATQLRAVSTKTATSSEVEAGVVGAKRTGVITRRSVVSALVMLVVAGGALYLALAHRSAPGNAATARPTVLTSLAVLPFKSLSSEPSNDDPGLGITDVLITRLSNVREILVRPTSAVLKYKDRDQDPIEAGRALKVDAVLEGSVQRIDERIRVTVRLMDVKKGAQLFGGSFTESAADMLKVQDAISERITKALSVELSSDTPSYTRNTKAHDLYAEARALFNRRDSGSIKKAEMRFRQAIEEDPGFALAYVGVADALALQNSFYEARALQEKALSLERNLGEAHASIGFRQMFYDWDWEQAEQSFKRAIDLKPGYGRSYLWYGNLLAITGRLGEAKETMQRGLEIDPFSHNLLADLGQVHYFSRDYDRAIELCEKALEVEPDFMFAYWYLSEIYRQRGEFEKSIEASLRKGFAESGESSSRDARTEAKNLFRRYDGQRAYLQDSVSDLKRRHPFGLAYEVARLSAALGDKEQAVDYLEKSYQHRIFLLPFVGVDPIFSDLRSEPRYRDLLRRMGLTRLVSQ